MMRRLDESKIEALKAREALATAQEQLYSKEVAHLIGRRLDWMHGLGWSEPGCLAAGI